MKRKISLKNKLSTKKIILTGLTSAIACIPIATSVAYAVNKNTYIFDGRHFASKGSVLNYVKNNAQKVVGNVEGYNSQWKITVNNKVQTFSSSEQLRKTLYDSYIKEQLYRTNVDLKQYENENGILGLNGNVWENIFDVSSESARIYQGANDSIKDSEDDAYKSYFNQKDAYYFNGIYFNTRNELKDYLIKEYLPGDKEANTKNTIVIQGPNGKKSAPIKLTSPDAIQEISSFIANNAKKVLTYTNSKTGQITNITNQNINSAVNDVSLRDLNYIHVQSNQGQSRYVIDNQDESNLIGPYFYNGTLDVGAFMNKKMWKKVNGVTDSVYVESKVDSMIGSFFTSIINDDASLALSDISQNHSSPVLFRTMLLDTNGKSYDEKFLNDLKLLSPELEQAVTQANLTLLQGKKYNTFNKIPILYSFLMQRAITWGLGQDVINLIIDYFTNVCNFIQDAIELVVMDNSLLKSKDNKTTFNVAKFFEIGNPEYDLNTSTEYFLNQIKTQYPSLVAAMNTYIGAQNNIAMLAGLIPYSALDNSFLVEFKIFKSNDELSALKPKLENIYNTFSSLNYDDMLKLYINHSSREDVQAIKSFEESKWKEEFAKLKGNNSGMGLDLLLSGIGAKNNEYHSLARAMLDNEIKAFIETGKVVKGGYLSKLYSSNPNEDKLGPFIDLVTNKDNKLDTYKIYLAVLVDKRMETKIFNKQVMADPYLFARSLSKVIVMGLNSGLLVNAAIKRLYKSKVTNPYADVNVQSSITKTNTSKDVYGTSTNFVGSTWTKAVGEDTSPLSNPINNPLFKIINENDENTTISKAKAKGVTVTIDPNDPNIAQKINLLKYGSNFESVNVNTKTPINNLQEVALLKGNEKLFPNGATSLTDVKVVVDRYNVLKPVVIEKAVVLPNPADNASLKTAEYFDGEKGYFSDLETKIKFNVNSSIFSSNTEKLQAELKKLATNIPKKQNYANAKDYEKDLNNWRFTYEKTKAQFDLSKINDAHGFAVPESKNYADYVEYWKASKQWESNVKQLEQYLAKHEPNKVNDFRNKLGNVPSIDDYRYGAKYEEAAQQYKKTWDSWLKQNAPQISTDNVVINGPTTTPINPTPDVPNNNPSVTPPTTGSGSSDSNTSTKPNKPSVSIPGNNNENIMYPHWKDYKYETDWKRDLDTWKSRFDKFINGWIDNMPRSQQIDYWTHVGNPPKRWLYDTEYEYYTALEKWANGYNDWVLNNLPHNTGELGDIINSGHGGNLPQPGGSTNRPGSGSGSISRPNTPGSDIEIPSRPTTPGGDIDSDIPSRPSSPNFGYDEVDGMTSRPGSSRPITPSDVADFENPTQKISRTQQIKNWWSGNSQFAKIKEITMVVVENIAQFFSTVMVALEVFFFIFDLLQVNYTQDFYEYTTADGTHFYWDGGLTVSRYMGLDVKQEKGIEGMELLNPIQVTLPQVEEFYYYNQVKYYDTVELKKDSLSYMLNGGSKTLNSSFKLQYTFSNASSIYENKTLSLDDLIASVLKDINVIRKDDGSIDESKINPHSEYVSETSTTFDNGLTVSGSDNYVSVAQSIANNIRPTRIAMLPNTKNGMALGIQSQDFVFPGNYWNGSKVVKQDSNQFTNYVIDNSANQLKPGITISGNRLLTQNDYVNPNTNDALNQSSIALFNKFKNAFTINSKTILKNQITVPTYSQANGDNFVKPLYMVNVNGNTIYFADETKATNYVLTMLNFQKETPTQKVTSYIYNGIYFANDKALESWVLSQI